MKRPVSAADEVPEKKQCLAQDEPLEVLEKKLSEMIRYKKKLSTKKAKFIVTLDDLKSFEKSMSDREVSEWTLPQFFVQDLQRVVLFSLIGNQYRFFPRWCKIMRPNHIKKVYLITVNNLSESDYKANQSFFKKFDKLFSNHKKEPYSIEIVSPFANGSNFVDEFSSVPITRTQWLKIRDETEFQKKRADVAKKYTNIFKRVESTKSREKSKNNNSNTSTLDKIPRTCLLLNTCQMVREDYPISFDQSGAHVLDDYVYTNDSYTQVHNASPLFSIDCEMCYNEDGEMETVWIALVNEALECVFESFIKPKKRIRNFLTHITGVSAKTIENVTVQLEDVQQKLRQILPPDAILCGQSLNNDLHSIKMFHPYVIDTSVIYNLSGNREIKPSLKRLSAQFLGKLIQEGTHNPSIDAKASIQLCLLKLRQGLDFGDVIVNGCVNVYDEDKIEQTINNMTIEDIDLSDPRSISKFIYQTGLNIDQNVFNVLRDNKISTVYIDSNEACANDSLNTTTESHLYESNEEAFKLMNEFSQKENEKFIWSQLYIKENDQNDASKLKELVKSIKSVYENISDDSLFMVAFTGRSDQLTTAENRDADFLKGRCFMKYKCEEMDTLETEVKTLYDSVTQLKNKNTPDV